MTTNEPKLRDGDIVTKSGHYEWVVCEKCNKEYQRKVWDERLRDVMVKWCAVCEMETQKELNMCPESISQSNGGGSCIRPFRHEGRCKPIDTVAVIASRLPEFLL